MRDLDFIHELTAGTVICPNCSDRLVVDKKLPNVKYCHCPNTTSVYNMKIADYSWVPFVETPDLLIWRQPHETQPGLFVYKGSWNLSVQLLSSIVNILNISNPNPLPIYLCHFYSLWILRRH